MGFWSNLFSFAKPARKRRRAKGSAKKATKKVCPKRTPAGKKVYRAKGTCFTRKRVKKVSQKA